MTDKEREALEKFNKELEASLKDGILRKKFKKILQKGWHALKKCLYLSKLIIKRYEKKRNIRVNRWDV